MTSRTLQRCWAATASLAALVGVGPPRSRGDEVPPPATEAGELQAVIRGTARRVVKVYGAGGLTQFEAYQSGLMIDPSGRVLTVLSYVLDTDDVAVVLDDGRRFAARVVGADPLLELALLELERVDEPLPAFDLDQAVSLVAGQRILAASNLYGIASGDEPVSMQQGVVTATARLDARRGAYAAAYRGDAYILDAVVNNPGAAGGAVVDGQGRLGGVIGKELRSRATGGWLNYALPIEAVRQSVARMRRSDGAEAVDQPLLKPAAPLSLAKLGIVLVPELLPRTPPFVDAVFPGSPAAAAGLRPDDLIVGVDSAPIAASEALRDELARREADAPTTLSILRRGELIEATLDPATVDAAAAAAAPPDDPQSKEQP